MSVRYYCDVCGAELSRADAGNRIKRTWYDREHYSNIGVEVMTSQNGCWNTGHLCASCIVRVVTDGSPV